MTIQLELQFNSSYVADALTSLYMFASGCSSANNKSRYFPRYKKLQKEAQYLVNYAYLNGHITDGQYAFFQNGIFESSDLFWS